MNKTKYKFFEQIYMAIAKPTQYFKLTKAGGGRITGFVFLFVLITSLFTIIPIIYSAVGPNGFVKYINEDIPAFELSHGELYTAERYENDDRLTSTYILIDSNIEQFTKDDIDDLYDQVILISKTNMLTYQYGRYQEIDFSAFGNISFDNSIIDVFIPLIYLCMAIIVIFVYLFRVGAYFVTALLFSVVGLIVAAATNSQVKYHRIFKTAIYGKVTTGILAALLSLLEFFIPVNIPGLVSLGIKVLIVCAYVVYGTLSHNSDEAREDNELRIPPQTYM